MDVIKTDLRINFVQLHHNLSQELVPWPILCMEIHRRAAESSNEWVHLYITERFSFNQTFEILTNEGAAKQATKNKMIFHDCIPCLDCANHMLDDLRGCEHFQHYQEHRTWLEEQTIYSQPDRERTDYPTRKNKIILKLCSLQWLPKTVCRILVEVIVY